MPALTAAGRRVPHTRGCSWGGCRAPGSQRGPAPPPRRPNDWLVLLPVREEGEALAPPLPGADAGSSSAAARADAARPERAHWAPRPAPGRGWGPAAERPPLRRVLALAGSELPLGGAFKLLLERRALEVCPCPQRAHIQLGFFLCVHVCACVFTRYI